MPLSGILKRLKQPRFGLLGESWNGPHRFLKKFA
jgi:hypothetical protein